MQLYVVFVARNHIYNFTAKDLVSVSVARIKHLICSVISVPPCWMLF